MEEKLRNAAERLPEPRTAFSRIEAAAETRRRGRFRRWRVAAAVVCIVLMATISVAAATEVKYGGWVNWFITHGGVERRLDIEIPEEIGDSPCYDIREVNVVPMGTSWLEALFSADYRWYGIDYGRREQVEVFTSDEYGYGTTGYTETYDPWSLVVGTTEEELWKHCFSVGEDGLLEDEDTLNGVHLGEYLGVTLQYATDVYHHDDGTPDVYSHHVLWVDEEKQVVFSLRRTDYQENTAEFPMELLEAAREIIEMNRE